MKDQRYHTEQKVYKIKEPSTKNKILIITNFNDKQPDLKERAAVYKKKWDFKEYIIFSFLKNWCTL